VEEIGGTQILFLNPLVHNVLFFKFSDSHGEYEMLKLFQRWARVKEVFISRRLNRWGRRFGFVRFFYVENAMRLERDLDSLYIGNRKLYVNLPRYQRDRYGRKDDESKVPTGARIGREVYSNGLRKGKEVWREKRGNEGHTNDNVSKSYADVVRMRTHEQWAGPSLTTKALTLPWMSNSWVGRLSTELNFELLQEECLKGGMSMFRARSLGDNLVLLTPKTEEKMEDIFKLNKEWFESCFEDFKPWSASCVAGYRIVWVKCYGLPLSLWSKECFSKVVGEVATLVEVDEATSSWDRLEYARLRVRLLHSAKADMSKGFRINGVVYNINIMEEAATIVEGKPICKCTFYHESSSDSVSLTETFVENTIFSVDSGKREGGDEGADGSWPEMSYGGGRGRSLAGIEKSQEKECSGSVEGCQKKKVYPFSRKKLSEPVVSAAGSALSAKQKVSNTRDISQKSVVVLEEEMEVSSNLNTRPISFEAHSKQRGQQVQLGKKGVCELQAGEAVGQPWNKEASGSHMACELATAGKKHNVSISMVVGESKDVRGEIKEAMNQEGKEEQQEGLGEIPALDDSQNRVNMLQTHDHVHDRRSAGQDEGAMVMCDAVLEGSVQGTHS